MKSVRIKRLVVYKNHFFPHVHKPLRSITDYLELINPDLDKLKVKKMKQILDEEQKRRIKQKTKAVNEELNIELQKYYRRYIKPFEGCPDYYRMLFSYAKKKAEWMKQNRIIKEEPLYLAKKQIKRLLKESINQKQETQNTLKEINENQKSEKKLSSKEIGLMEKEMIQSNKLLFEVYKMLYPSEKVEVYSSFEKQYRQFLAKQQSIAQQLTDSNIIYLSPFMFRTPIEFYQSKNPELTLKECQNLLIDDQKLRQTICQEFTKLTQERFDYIHFIAKKFQVSPASVRRPIWEQYVFNQKETTFYNLIKSNLTAKF